MPLKVIQVVVRHSLLNTFPEAIAEAADAMARALG